MRERLTKRIVDAADSRDRRTYLWDVDVTGFGLMVTPGGAKSYVFQYRRPGEGRSGQARRITLGRHGDLTPEQARKLAAKLLVEVRSGGDPAADRRGDDAHSVAELAHRFLTEYLPGKKRQPRASTITYYEILFRVHVIPTLGDKRLDQISSADVEKLHSAMRKTPYIANRVLSLLQHAFDQAERWGWRPQHSNPALHVERYREDRRGAKKEVMLDAAQMGRLMAAIDEEEATGGVSTTAAAVLRVVFWTGWRVGEVLRLRWANLDLGKGIARLVETKTAREEYRQVPSEAVAVLKEMPKVAGCPYVFPGEDLKHHLTTVRKPWAKIRKRAGLDALEGLGAFRIHDLRHNVVSWDVSRGVPLEIAGKNVGHRSRRSTEVYAHFAPDALKRAADERAAAMRRAVEEG